MKIGFAATWRETFAAASRERSLYLTIGAAFVLLPVLAAAVLGPPEPRNIAELRGSALAIQGVVALIGAVAQLAIARLVTRGGGVGEALRHAALMVPRLVLAALLTALALLPAIALLQLSTTSPGALLPALVVLIPGLYVVARLALALPILADSGGGPIDALRRSWHATAGNAWRILGLMAALLGVLIALMLLAGGVAAALGSVLTLLGGKALAAFVVALVSAAVATLYTIYNAVLLGRIHQQLVA